MAKREKKENMMKRLLVFVLLIVLLTACQEQPTYVDNGTPGQIRAVFFFDDNKNGVMDDGEAGVQAQAIVGIAQEISCPPTSTPSFVDTDASGVHEFKNLKPGKYCLYLNNGFSPTTKLTQEAYVSSDLTTMVFFGIVR
ncbi:MAG: hypothetical protein C4583_08990 [Anaerolineaceae bacterium]|nr:MAG: hypothetical protein C4583_08990 [Anaerolineaceae bacterium]